jgi:hypothetical protein
MGVGMAVGMVVMVPATHRALRGQAHAAACGRPRDQAHSPASSRPSKKAMQTASPNSRAAGASTRANKTTGGMGSQA